MALGEAPWEDGSRRGWRRGLAARPPPYPREPAAPQTPSQLPGAGRGARRCLTPAWSGAGPPGPRCSLPPAPVPIAVPVPAAGSRAPSPPPRCPRRARRCGDRPGRGMAGALGRGAAGWRLRSAAGGRKEKPPGGKPQPPPHGKGPGGTGARAVCGGCPLGSLRAGADGVPRPPVGARGGGSPRPNSAGAAPVACWLPGAGERSISLRSRRP